MIRILFTVLLCLLGFVPKVFADDPCPDNTPLIELPYTLPATIGSYTYTDVVASCYSINNNNHWRIIYYNYDSLNSDYFFETMYHINFHLADYGDYPWSTVPGESGGGGAYNLFQLNNVYTNRDIYSLDGNTLFFSANLDSDGSVISEETPTVTVNIIPPVGGSVAIGNNTCDSSNIPCQYLISAVGQMVPEATANTGYAFGGWLDVGNPHALSLNGYSGSQTITAMFYKTFRNAVTDEDGFTYDIDDIAGECVIYVREETGIPYDACHGDAADCFVQAQSAGFSTGLTPKVGAIAVFDRNTFPDMGHVGIVKEVFSETSIRLRHSNYSTYHAVSEETVDLTAHPVLGYIYSAYPMP